VTSTFTHLDESGAARMVDVNAKAITRRTAVATAVVTREVEFEPAEIEAARAAGELAVKKTPLLIPLCHPVPVGDVEIEFQIKKRSCFVTVTVNAYWKTGVEMEALTAAGVVALVLTRGSCDARIDRVHVVSKTGGKSGDWGSQC
jgi:cyclic pyranopterin phosphate synthase